MTRNKNQVTQNKVNPANLEACVDDGSDESLESVFKELSEMKNNGWKDLDDPEKEWLKLRGA